MPSSACKIIQYLHQCIEVIDQYLTSLTHIHSYMYLRPIVYIFNLRSYYKILVLHILQLFNLLLGQFGQSILWQGNSCHSESSIVRPVALVRSCLHGILPPYSAYIPCFQISYNSLTITLVSAPTSCFILAVPMREIYRVWDKPYKFTFILLFTDLY